MKFIVNDYITLKLEDNETIIYVNNIRFDQCRFLLLEIPVNEIKFLQDIESIDRAIEKLDNSMEIKNINEIQIPPEVEFWGHCSNLQVWYENNYNTRLLHSNLAFPLLKELTKAGDPLAKKVFKEEIAKRFLSGHPSVMRFLGLEYIIKEFNNEETEFLVRESLKKHILVFHYLPIFKNLNLYHKKQAESLIEEAISSNDPWIKIIAEKAYQPVILRKMKEEYSREDEIEYWFNDKTNELKLLIVNIYESDHPSQLNEIKFLGKLIYLKKLMVHSPKLTNLNGIENLTGLEEINFSYHKISKIERLENLRKLKVLNLANNNLKEIKGLENLLNLECLNLYGNQIMEITGLSRLKKLRTLNLGRNQIKEIGGLEELSELRVLRLDNNQILKIKGLDNLLRLEELNLNENQIFEIKGLKNLKNLKELSIEFNKIKDIRELDELVNLQYLNLEYNQIIELKGLENLKNIRSIRLKNNKIPAEFLEQFKITRNYVKYCRNEIIK